jgi:hypothetical protein
MVVFILDLKETDIGISICLWRSNIFLACLFVAKNDDYFAIKHLYIPHKILLYTQRFEQQRDFM